MSNTNVRVESLGHCPGLFRGEWQFPIPVSCDIIHFTLGILGGAVTGLRCTLVGIFIFYQALEELPDWDVKSFVKDVAVFLLGLATSVTIQHIYTQGKLKNGWPVHKSQ